MFTAGTGRAGRMLITVNRLLSTFSRPLKQKLAQLQRQKRVAFLAEAVTEYTVWTNFPSI